MSDEADKSDERIELAAVSGYNAAHQAVSKMPAGVPGECEKCGEDMPRLVDGVCCRCRDRIARMFAPNG